MQKQKASIDKYKRDKVTIIIVSSILALVVLDLTPIGGNTMFYVKWMQCGRRPLYTRKGAGLTPGVPNYINAPSFGFARGFMPYYCTAREAELAGYSSDQIKFNFPHLSEQERQQAYKNAQKIMHKE